jgi:transcriptional regulator with XRE-family HTH domain
MMDISLIERPTAGDLRAIRERMQLSQVELARAIGFKDSGERTIRAWENDEIEPTGLAWHCLRYLAAVWDEYQVVMSVRGPNEDLAAERFRRILPEALW